MKTRFLFLLVITVIFAGCTDWKAEYKKRLNEAFEPVKDKFEFAEGIYKDCDNRINCVTYDSYKDLPAEHFQMLDKMYTGNEKSVLIQHPYDWIVLHNCARDGMNIGDKKYFDKDDLSSYYSYRDFNSSLNKKGVDAIIDNFNNGFVKVFERAKYLLLVTDKILIKPEVINAETFNMGYVYSEVKIYDLNTKEEIGTFDVLSENSDRLSTDLSAGQMIENLYNHHKDNVLVKASKMVQ